MINQKLKKRIEKALFVIGYGIGALVSFGSMYFGCWLGMGTAKAIIFYFKFRGVM